MSSRATCNRQATRIWKSYHNCKLPPNYIVHHCDGNVENNEIDNLLSVSRSHHSKLSIRLWKFHSYQSELQDREWLYQKYVIEKLSSGRIAKMLRRPSSQVVKWLKIFNIKMRTRSEALRGREFTKEWRMKISRAMMGNKNQSEVNHV